MKFTEDLSTQSLNIITGFEPGYVVVQNKKIDSSHIIAPDAVHDWGISSFHQLDENILTSLLQFKPEVIILGTGEKHIIPEKDVLKVLVKTGIGFEIMNTSAACRTYNILVAEGRRAVAGLII